jgi:hypothetical protein
MLKKSISILMAVLMIAAVTTVSAFAITGPQIFYNYVYNEDTEEYEYVYAGDQAQHMVVSASNANGETTIVLSAVLGPYTGTITPTVLTPDVDWGVTTAGSTVTLTYAADPGDIVEVNFDIEIPAVPNHPDPTYYVIVN